MDHGRGPAGFGILHDAVVDLTEKLADPFDVLFGTPLGGAVTYYQSLVRAPGNTVLVLISDLYEGAVEAKVLRRSAELVEAGVRFITLLALSDEGRPSCEEALAAKLAALGVPRFACTSDRFPSLMAAAIRREDINAWAAR